MLNCLAVGAGGFIGCVMRYVIGLIPLGSQADIPWKTLIINVSAAFLIGAVAAGAGRSEVLSPRMVLLMKSGFCGGFSTLSAFALETAGLFESGKIISGLVYTALTIVLPILAVWLAAYMVK